MPDIASRSKEDYLALIKEARKRNGGNNLHLPIFRIHQSERFEMFAMPLRQDLCQLFFQRLPRTLNNPNGIQRAWKATKITDIRDLAKNDPLYSAPGSIVVTVQTKNRPWVTVKWNGNGIDGELVVDLKQVEANLEKLEPGADGSLEEEAFKIGYMLDAHHRTEGHFQAGKMEMEMVAVAYVDLVRKNMARVFAQVNEKQDKPSPTHTLAMRQMAGMLKSGEKLAVEIGHGLNDDENSILHKRIKTIDGKLPRGSVKPYLNLKSFTDHLTRFVLNDIAAVEPDAAKQETIERYLRAWRASFPDAWEDDSAHVLVKAMGFSIMCQVFGKVLDLTIAKYHSDTPSEAQFKKVVSLLHKMKLEVGPDEGHSQSVPLDWSSSTFGSLSSGKGINFVSQEIKKYLARERMRFLKSSK